MQKSRGDISRDVGLATILLKVEREEALTGVEKIQYVAYAGTVSWPVGDRLDPA